MAVDAVDLALIGGEEIAERGVALQLRRADDERHRGLAEDRLADLDRPADAADRGAGIEGRADLVVADRRRRALFSQSKAGVRCASIQSGVSLRLVPARPIARQCAEAREQRLVGLVA